MTGIPLVVLALGLALGTWLGVTSAPVSSSALPPVLPQLLRATEATGTARFVSSLSVAPVGGPPTVLSIGTGAVDFRTRAFRAQNVVRTTDTMVTGAAPSVQTPVTSSGETIAADGLIYDRSSSSGEASSWTEEPLPALGGSPLGWFGLSPPGAPLAPLFSPDQIVRLVGTARTRLGGAAVTRYDFTSTLDRSRCPASSTRGPTAASVFTDGNGRIVLLRMTTAIALPKAAVLPGATPAGALDQPGSTVEFVERSTVRLSHFGSPADIVAPRVVRAPGLGGGTLHALSTLLRDC
jgi:hypothetical protein